MLQTVCDSELKRRSYSHCKQITPKCCEISLLLREFRSLFVQCYGIPPEATRYMPQAGTLRTSRWKPISQPCEFNLLLRKYFAALLSGRITSGGWGVCFTYATWFALAGLAVVGKTYSNSKTVRKGVDFLLSKQKVNGDWGESYLSCPNMVYIHLERGIT
ncbi:unnamed protein product, partial [Vitis vinifera]